VALRESEASEVAIRVARDDADKLLDGESEMICGAQAGDRSAFAGLVDRYWDRLHRWLYHLTRDGHAAEDLTQETFLKAFAGLNTFRPGSNFRAWLFRIAHNNFVNLYRARGNGKGALPTEVATADESPVDTVLSREAFQQLGKAVGKLPPDFRSAFLLRAEEGLSFRQVADVLGITEQTARWRVFKARQKLMQVLSPELFPPAFRPEMGESP
jgi:RNA polymerase sigma-70 factor, ECF subfamily